MWLLTLGLAQRLDGGAMPKGNLARLHDQREAGIEVVDRIDLLLSRHLAGVYSWVVSAELFKKDKEPVLLFKNIEEPVQLFKNLKEQVL